MDKWEWERFCMQDKTEFLKLIKDVINDADLSTRQGLAFAHAGLNVIHTYESQRVSRLPFIEPANSGEIK